MSGNRKISLAYYFWFLFLLGVILLVALEDGVKAESNETEEGNSTIAARTADFSRPPEADISWMDVDRPATVARYSGISMTDEERQELAAVVYLEAGDQTAEGQQAVAEVVLNRVISDDFPGGVHDVLHQSEGTAVLQFSSVGHIGEIDPPQQAYDAVDAALYGESILSEEVLYFSRKGENDHVWGTIGDHVFCMGYI